MRPTHRAPPAQQQHPPWSRSSSPQERTIHPHLPLRKLIQATEHLRRLYHFRNGPALATRSGRQGVHEPTGAPDPIHPVERRSRDTSGTAARV